MFYNNNTSNNNTVDDESNKGSTDDTSNAIEMEDDYKQWEKYSNFDVKANENIMTMLVKAKASFWFFSDLQSWMLCQRSVCQSWQVSVQRWLRWTFLRRRFVRSASHIIIIFTAGRFLKTLCISADFGGSRGASPPQSGNAHANKL